MPNDLSTWLALAVVAAMTFGTRIAGALLMARFETSPRVERFLDSLSVAVIAALVASVLAQAGGREVLSVALAILIMVVTRSAIGAMVAGMAGAALWSYGLP